MYAPRFLVCIAFCICGVKANCRHGQPQWTGEKFWNERYSMGYNEARRFPGFWSYDCDLRGSHPVVLYGYGRHYRDYQDDLCTGCRCNDYAKTVNCTEGQAAVTQLFVKRKSYFPTMIESGFFLENLTHITLLGLPLQHVAVDIFYNLTKLTELTIHGTSLERFPDLQFNYDLTWIDLSRNKLRFHYPNDTSLGIALSVSHVNLVENEISWIPPNLFSGTNVKFIALSANNIGPLVPSQSFINMPFLQYISFDANKITQLSKTEMNRFRDSPLQHFNVSNNQITCVQAHTFDNVTQLKILEMHHNSIPDFSTCLFHGLQEILHIDLSHNKLTEIGRDAFRDLPNLKRLRLHSQQIACVDHRAFVDLPILAELFLGSNQLPTFPHATFEWRNWPNLHSIHADRNLIKSIVEYPEVSFKGREWELYCSGLPKFEPFRNLTSITAMRLSHNEITSVAHDTFCHMPRLRHLTLNNNQITSESLHTDLFLCTQEIALLQLSSNKLEYIPPAIIGKERLPNVRELYLNSNQFGFVEAGDFSELSNLTELWLNGNRILTIENGSFPTNLVQLGIRYNKFFNFKHESPFANLTKLRELYLDNNAIEYIPRQAFQNLRSLRILQLHFNKIGIIPYEAFQDSPALLELMLRNNEISHVEDGAFGHLSKWFRYFTFQNNLLSHLPNPKSNDFSNLRAENVWMQNNLIERVRAQQFCNVTASYNVDLSSNRITVVERQGFKNVQARDSINLNGNTFKYLHETAFDGVQADQMFMTGMLTKTLVPCTFRDVTLENWRMDGGEINVIQPQVFCNIQVSETLSLNNNNLNLIEGQIFSNGSSVNKLKLGYNQLTSIPNDAFSGAKISEIELRNNLLDTYPVALNSQKLQRIDLQFNQIRNLPNNAFDGQSSVRYLLLSNNRLSELQTAVFDKLVSLEDLHLSNNEIEFIEDGVFSNPILKKLDFIDLRNNSILYLPAFGDLPSLRTIDLGNNQLLSTISGQAFDEVADTLQELRLDSVGFHCNCDVVRALYRVRSRIHTTGICLEPAQATGVQFHRNDTIAADYFVNVMTATPETFWCSVANFTATTSPDCDVTAKWDPPQNLYFDLNATSGILNGIPLQDAVDCNCIDVNVTSSPGNLTQTKKCGLFNHTTVQQCVAQVISYNVTCRSASAPDLWNITSDTTVRFLPVQPGTKYQCEARIIFNNSESTSSRPAWVQVLDKQVNIAGSTASSSKWLIPITHYDFSINHMDFGGSQATFPSKPTFAFSPFGSWLSTGSNATLDKFIEWFRAISGINHDFDMEFYLETNSTIDDQTYRFYDDAYYPLDGLGFRSESQRDCNNVLHNFGFTSAIRIGMVFSGGEVITIGGGDIMWLYVNMKLVAEYNNYIDTSKINCITVQFSVPYQGNVNVTSSMGEILNQQCVVSSSIIEEMYLDVEVSWHNNVTWYLNRRPENYCTKPMLYVQVGGTYHFDLFRVEREHCTSEFLLEIKGVTLNVPHINGSSSISPLNAIRRIGLDSTTVATVTTQSTTLTSITTEGTTSATNYFTTLAPLTNTTGVLSTVAPTLSSTTSNATISDVSRLPVDVIIPIPENIAPQSYVASFALADSFSLGPPFDVYISDGNSEGKFYISGATLSSPSIVTLPPPNGSLVTIGNSTFIDCDTIVTQPQNVTTAVNDTLLTINDVIAHIFVASSLDYENEQAYLLHVIIEDTAANISGSLVIRLQVTDINDNCPTSNFSGGSFHVLRPPLSATSPFLALNATDADSGVNALVDYTLSDVIRSSSGNESTEFLNFQIATFDGGSPTLGRIANVSIEVSTSCLYRLLGNQLEFTIHIALNIASKMTELYARLPGYYSAMQGCQKALGPFMNTAFIASSEMVLGNCSDTYSAYNAMEGSLSHLDSWIPATHDQHQWLQIDFLEVTRLHSMAIKGSPTFNYWTKEFVLSYSDDGLLWQNYELETATSNSTNSTFKAEQILTGNNNSASLVSILLDPQPVARYLRVMPVSWNIGIALRLELHGCNELAKLKGDSECHRCPSSYYCPGDGRKLPCARCRDSATVGEVDTLTNVSLYNATCGRSPTEHSSDGRAECTPCPDSHVCSDGIASTCPTHYYTAGCNDTWCSPCTSCEPGHECRSGVRYPCDLGHYSADGQSDHCRICDAGSFANITGSTFCKTCLSGYHSYLGSAECSPCKAGTWSNDGSRGCKGCDGKCPCEVSSSPCFPNVQCVNVELLNNTMVAECLDCPLGFSGDGWSCFDIDECLLANPCFEASACTNTYGGFQCDGCPVGFHGRPYFGRGLEATSPPQVCDDVDECFPVSSCDSLAECNNTQGNYTCSQCPLGYTGTGYTTCVKSNPCVQRVVRSRCDKGASCQPVSNHNNKCQCPIGQAGPGEACGIDEDLDGQPDLFIQCGDVYACAEDNCIGLPNSGQEDTDGDRRGDACDVDDDNDFVLDYKDNCPLVPNYNASGVQLDSDGDGHGDACDTCPFLIGQYDDTDGDGLGDPCDDDDDNDGVLDGSDICPLDPMVNTGPDSDKDGVGDACDNCVFDSNALQSDSNQNGVGNACDNGTDADGDSVLDFLDNCPFVPNPSQSDWDSDGLGDLCDIDSDEDGKSDLEDHCPFTYDPTVEDDSSCKDDYDNDGVLDVDDTCIKDPTISQTALLPYIVVNLNSGTILPEWKVYHKGRAVTQKATTPIPSMLIGAEQRYGAADLTGSFYVDHDTSEGLVGFVFAYQNNRQFYLVTWGGEHRHDDQGGLQTSLKGIQIKMVDSVFTGPGPNMADALWKSLDTSNQAEMIYHDPTLVGWEAKTPYNFRVQHRPSVGVVRVVILLNGNVLVDSGSVYDTRYTGGRVGVFAFNQGNIIWSNLQIKCTDRENTALSLNGVDDHVLLPSTKSFNFEDSVTVEFWMKSANKTVARQPVFCTVNSTLLCVFIENGTLSATFGYTITVTSLKALEHNAWSHVTLRYDAGGCELTLMTNGSLPSAGDYVKMSDVSAVDWSPYSGNQSVSLAIGWDGSGSHYQGLVDDLRIYDRALSDAEIDSYAAQSGLIRHKYQRILTGSYDMNYYDGQQRLTDDGSYQNHGVISGNPSFVESSADQARFILANP